MGLLSLIVIASIFNLSTQKLESKLWQVANWTEEVVVIWRLASYPGILLAKTVEVSLNKAPNFPLVQMVSVNEQASVYNSTIQKYI